MSTRVAVLGAGRMGGAMAGSIVRAGFDVAVWNRTPAKAHAVAGAIGGDAAESIAEAVDGVDVVVTSLADDAAVTEVYTGEGGLAATVAGGVVIAEMSTIAPATVRRVGQAVAASTGASVIDAPVSGSVGFAEKGELTLMVGGEAPALERARPVLDAVSKRIFHLGELGTGATMKLAVNSLLHGLNLALSEALVLAEQAGIERAAAYEVFASGAVAAPFVLYKQAAYEHPEETPVAFSLDLVAKDLDLILDLAREVDVTMDQASVNRDVVRAALEAGLGERDLSALAVLLRR